MLGALRFREGEGGERGQEGRDALVQIGEGGGLVGVQAERAQASLMGPERHAEHAAHIQSRCFRGELRPALVLAGVLDPEGALAPGGIDAGAVSEPLLEAV
jgi:hypothetical protein